MLLAVLGGFLVYGIYHRVRLILTGVLGVYLGIMLLHLVFIWKSDQKRQLVIWQHKQYQVVSVTENRHILWMANPGWYREMQSSRHTTHAYAREQGIRDMDNVKMKTLINGLQVSHIGTEMLAVVDSNLVVHKAKIPLHVRWLVLTPRIRMSPESLFSLVNSKQVIANGTYRGKRLERWRTACGKAGIEFYAVSEQGAYLCNW